ncbi:hypothetical protein FHX48_001503 [Microbacterium halimionae]|uniref:SseB protein N-terminal domain-containing protein n=1 Tax=Microbacterium halimionae TaxID=1526413 RepID=A0A7W3JP35_9MICO|nr:SseB family protein [Microbacterium halimionae]MBA8816430.1 hypothetical protein [Microbacterium halimionae]NII95384.1 hypothetical protein [Microbacterium halimionae]
MSPEADGSTPARAGDSAGVPWEGRSFEPNTHSDDDGSADPQLIAALEAPRGESGNSVAIIESYRTARLLIPLVAKKGEEGVSPTGLRVDKTQELSIVTVGAPDGRTVMPVFTSVDAMRSWDAAARPVPADGVRTAVAAVTEQTDLIVIDPGSPSEYVVRRPALWALAHGETWEPSYRSPAVFAGIEESISGELSVIDFAVADGDPEGRLRGPELIVILDLADGLAQEQLDAVLSRLARRWATDDRIATLVDSLQVTLRTSR